MAPRLTRLLDRAVRIRAGELRAALWSFAYFFCLLCSYYILRPVVALGLTGIALVALPLATSWIAVALYLGRRQEGLRRARAAVLGVGWEVASR
ncbi:MAG: hypothetical protein ACREF4_22590 [Gammaproteobacteria bacterium]